MEQAPLGPHVQSTRRQRRRNADPFMPFTPGYESQYRFANDQLNASLGDINFQRSQLGPMTDLFTNRMGTDQRYETHLLNQNLADRGLSMSSSPKSYLQRRDIDLPFDRRRQDFSFDMANRMAELQNAEAQAYLGYNQSLMEALLQNAADVASTVPLGLPDVTPQHNWERRKPTQPKKNKKKRRRAR